ncbi:MAG: hypothetical protein J6J39_07275, partial [Clostridia bacterium]|nr:hypothetical protein [Clostridia bacterium]
MKNKLIRKTLAIVLSAMIIFSALPIPFGAFAETASSQRSFTDDFSNADFTSSNWEAAIPSAYNGTAFQTKNEASYITTEDERTVLRASDGASNTNNIGDLLTNMPKDRRVESVTATFKQPRDFANEDASSGIVAFHINSRNSLVLCVYPYVNSKNAEDPNNDYIYYSWCRYSYATADTKNAKNNCVEIYNDQVTNVKKWRYSTGLVGDTTDWLTVTLTYDYSQIANNIITVSATLKDADGNEGTIPAFSAKFDDTVYDCTDADGNITESAAYLAYDENFRVGIAGSGANYYCYYDSFSVQYGKSFSEIANEFRSEYSDALNIISINSNEQFEKVMEAHSALNALPANVKEQLSAENSKLSGLLNTYKITCDDFENPNLFAGVWESIPYTGDIMTWNASSSSFFTGTTTSGTPASVIADSQDSTNNVFAPEYRNVNRKRKMLTLKEAYMRTDAQMKSFSTDVRCDLAVSWDASAGIYYYYKDVYNWGRIEYYLNGTALSFRIIEQAGTSTGENMTTINRASNTKLSDTGLGLWYNFKIDYVYNQDSTAITLIVTEKSSGEVVITKNLTSEYIIGDDFRVGYGAVNLTTNPMCFDNFELEYYKTADEFRAEYAETLALTTATVTVDDTKAVLDAKEALDGLTNVVKAQLNKE